MLTNKGKYGLKAMVHLAGMPQGQPALVADIAAANTIPKKFLDAILGELRNCGLRSFQEGPRRRLCARAPGDGDHGRADRARARRAAGADRLRQPRLLPPLRGLCAGPPVRGAARDDRGARRDRRGARQLLARPMRALAATDEAELMYHI